MPGVTDRDLGYDSLIRELRALGQTSHPRVYVGILQEDGEQYYESWYHTKGGRKVTKSKITLAGYAAANEFGATTSKGVTIPERSFLRSTVADNLAEYEAEIRQIARDFLDSAIKVPGSGMRTLERGFGRLGLQVKADVQNKIRDIKTPKNADITLARKYPANSPLQHTGRMRQSISHKVVMGGGAP